MRSHFCGLINDSLIGQTVTLCGWVNKARVQSHQVFVDVRDHEGIVQVLVESDQPELFAIASGLGLEDAVQITGTVRQRHAINEKIPTGRVEIVPSAIQVLNKAEPLPFHHHENPGEDIRLKYRYLDLRSPEMQRKMRVRTKLVSGLRAWLDARGFQDIETPILTKATPEGARDFLVPARMHPGEFYALPQSPQLFKQLLMMAGFDRYYQIARCFRDEALRADRQLEFTQLDMEFAWVDEADVQSTAEDMIRHVFAHTIGVDLPKPFPRMSYAEAMRRYGSDKPDLRIDLEFVDIADAVRGCGFKVFADVAASEGGRVIALRAPGAASYSRKQIDELTAHAAKHGAKGLAWMKVETAANGIEGVSSPIAKFLDADTVKAILTATGAADGDAIFFGAADARTASDFMGAVRLKLGKDLNLIADTWKPLWVTDFPMFEFDDEAQRFVALHHPFTAPAVDSIDDLRSNAATSVSRGYDMVLNGNEIGGGSIRIHRPQMQAAVFDLLGISADEQQAKFGFLLDALKYGAPPHGGIAFGIDRIAALMAGCESIRDVIAFPKTTGAQCLLTDAPSPIADAQLAEVHVQVRSAE